MEGADNYSLRETSGHFCRLPYSRMRSKPADCMAKGEWNNEFGGLSLHARNLLFLGDSLV